MQVIDLHPSCRPASSLVNPSEDWDLTLISPPAQNIVYGGEAEKFPRTKGKSPFGDPPAPDLLSACPKGSNGKRDCFAFKSSSVPLLTANSSHFGPQKQTLAVKHAVYLKSRHLHCHAFFHPTQNMPHWHIILEHHTRCGASETVA